MPKLSSYSSNYDDPGKFQDLPWYFWTDEERSIVIKNAYQNKLLKSKEIQPFLSASRTHSITQFIIPIASAILYFGPLKSTVFNGLFRRSPHIGIRGGAAFVGITTLYWLNLSPFLLQKEEAQQKLLDVLYHKLGADMKLFNQGVPRTWTPTKIDGMTRSIYKQRTSNLAGKLYTDEDITPPILPKHKANRMDGRIYL